MLDLSIVIAVRNEEKNLDELIRRLLLTVPKITENYEIIFVTDINKDRTLEILTDYHQKNSRIKILKLANGFGQYIAIMAGLDVSRASAVVIMDGDLQDYPEDIEKLYQKYSEGFDIVYAVKDSKDDSVFRNVASKIFVFIMKLLSDRKLDHNTNMFRIMSRRTVDNVRRYGEIDPSLTGLTSLIGFPTSTVKVTSGERLEGETNYNFFSLMNLAINSLLSFTTKPLRFISMFGLAISFSSLFYLLYLIISTSFFRNNDAVGWPTVISFIILLGGLQLLSLGIIGEYIGRIFLETKKRPLYIIDRKIGDLK
ncbi:MAG: glycosyltransferase family 2 protein [Bacteriovorax sp.]|jgi:glycosyltransferase involved in cell wall biosynthesis